MREDRTSLQAQWSSDSSFPGFTAESILETQRAFEKEQHNDFDRAPRYAHDHANQVLILLTQLLIS
jgi:hypothetical protein